MWIAKSTLAEKSTGYIMWIAKSTLAEKPTGYIMWIAKGTLVEKPTGYIMWIAKSTLAEIFQGIIENKKQQVVCKFNAFNPRYELKYCRSVKEEAHEHDFRLIDKTEFSVGEHHPSKKSKRRRTVNES
ncbi:hypothetical protein GIB67_032772 [Kingdonia uniflora]|uniref:Uncharacterized protein n=1 Tax=Kingdonia uniflora TaxID=39325 RepID=A0A7J7MW70_9MAGN|nr:hypothetical protein GIB67_032772 [Kingdonia uniflora]